MTTKELWEMIDRIRIALNTAELPCGSDLDSLRDELNTATWSRSGE